jgi:hypothetical protein
MIVEGRVLKMEGTPMTVKQSLVNVPGRDPGAPEHQHPLSSSPVEPFSPRRGETDEPVSAESPGPPPPDDEDTLDWRRDWFYPDRATMRRTLIGALAAAASLPVGFGLVALTGIRDDFAVLVWLTAMIGAGIYIRARTTVWAVYLGIVVPMILFEVGAFLILGSSEWEERNIEHWPGDESATSKLLGQVVEYLIFGVFFALLAGAGGLIGRSIHRWRWKRAWQHRQHPDGGAHAAAD